MNQLLTMLLTSEMNRSADTRSRSRDRRLSPVADVGNEPIGGHTGWGKGAHGRAWLLTSEMNRSADTVNIIQRARFLMCC